MADDKIMHPNVHHRPTIIVKVCGKDHRSVPDKNQVQVSSICDVYDNRTKKFSHIILSTAGPTNYNSSEGHKAYSCLDDL